MKPKGNTTFKLSTLQANWYYQIMPRSSRIDAPGALHHIIARGIGRGKIFNDDTDRNRFLDRLGSVLIQTETPCYAWALMSNHFHLLLRTADTPVSTIMRRLMTGYAMTYNRRHNRSGHLFQNRYKSILCQSEPYFLELVRYIHLNPVRAKLVKDLRQLDRYVYCGHSVLMANSDNTWQNTDEVLSRFGKRSGSARKLYRGFVQKGLGMGKRTDLTGGGLVRSMGGWSAVTLLRKAKTYMKGDERILGDSDFVEETLKQGEEVFERRYRLKAQGVDIHTLAQRVADVLEIPEQQVWSKGKYRHLVKARSLLCYWAVRELGMTMTELAPMFAVSVTAIGKSVSRGEMLVQEEGYEIEKS
jgi:REP element-mobilizing transposase RayT